MDEDEECLHENSSLNMYLQNLGYSDVQVTKNDSANLVDKFKISIGKSQVPLEVIDKEVIDQIEVITSTKLLFEEDISVVEIILSNFKVANNGAQKIMFQDSFGVIVIFLGLCLYLVIGYYAFVIISSFYAYKCADYFKRKKLVKLKLKSLTKILKRSSSSLQKSVNFMKSDEDRFMQYKVNKKVGRFEEESVNFYFYSRFRHDFLSCINKMTNILANSTEKLIKGIPLIDYADTPEYYLCNHFESNTEFDDPSKAYLLYSLVQSEFLRRLILSLIPNINLLSKQNNYNTLTKILGETVGNLTKAERILQNKFYISFHEGLRDESRFKLPETKKVPGSEYAEKFVSNFHDISNTFRNLHLKCRLIEESLITSDKLPDHVESDLVTIQLAINECRRNIDSNFILLKKSKENQREQTAVHNWQKNIDMNSLEKSNHGSDSIKQGTVELEEEEKEFETGDDSSNKVGYTDLDCMVEDDVFEAYVTNESQTLDFNVDDWDLDEVLKKKLISKISQNVMKELKGRLVEKAENRKKIEIDILKKKGLIGDSDEDSMENEEVGVKVKETHCDEVSALKNNTEGSTEFEKLVFEGSGDEDSCERTEETETQPQHSLGNQKKEFLKNLSEARKLIFKSPAAEDEFCFCGSDDETSE